MGICIYYIWLYVFIVFIVSIVSVYINEQRTAQLREKQRIVSRVYICLL